MTLKDFFKEKLLIPVLSAIMLSIIFGIPSSIIYFYNLGETQKQLVKDVADIKGTLKSSMGTVDSKLGEHEDTLSDMEGDIKVLFDRTGGGKK